jgi:hypothetical protein
VIEEHGEYLNMGRSRYRPATRISCFETVDHHLGFIGVGSCHLALEQRLRNRCEPRLSCDMPTSCKHPAFIDQRIPPANATRRGSSFALKAHHRRRPIKPSLPCNLFPSPITTALGSILDGGTVSRFPRQSNKQSHSFMSVCWPPYHTSCQ